MEVRTDCFAYDEKYKDCKALREMICKNRECKFYKSRDKINQGKIEHDIRNYSVK